MMDKVLKISLIAAIALFLYLYYTVSQQGRYQAITEYEGSLGILDTRQGVVYMLDIESDEWTLIKPFSPSRPIGSASPANDARRISVIFPPAPRGM
ncbi:MAG TPA: hypothetical protein VLG39_11355 [Nitrospirota bacterium]|nr:hypothetical protein [Nitrospirota bacterium]